MTKPELICYSTVRQFGGYALPVPIQNQLLRIYCEKNDFVFKLSSVESYVKNNYMYLNYLINTSYKKGNIGMCSIYMFPQEIEKYNAIERKIIDKELVFHFIFENCTLSYKDLRQFYMDSRLRFLGDENDVSIEELIE